MTGIGKAYGAQKNYEQATTYYTRALEKCAGNEYKNEQLIIYNLLGKLYLEQDATAKAYEYGLKSLGLTEECPNNIEVAMTYNLMGEIYTRLKKYDRATSYLDRAINFSKRSGKLEYERDAWQELSETYQQMHEPGKALEAYKNYVAIRDSVYSLEKVKEVTRHEMTADFNEKRAMLAAEQDKKNAVQQTVMDLTLKRQRLAYATFTVIIILLLSVGVLLRNRYKLREKLEMQLAIASERSRISAEMHDDLGSELSKISLLSELVKGDMAGQQAPQYLGNISRSSKDLVDKMGEIVWSLNSKYDMLENLVIYMRRYAKEFFTATEIDCIVDMPEHFPEVAIEGQIRRNIFLVMKEALHNILKHSGADRATITITADERGMKVKIQDNGTGIDPNAMRIFGNGLANMKKRTEDTGGEFSIKNENGTAIDLNFPFPA